MSDLLLVAPESAESAAGSRELTEAQVLLKQMVLDSVTSPNTRQSVPRSERATYSNDALGFSVSYPTLFSQKDSEDLITAIREED